MSHRSDLFEKLPDFAKFADCVASAVDRSNVALDDLTRMRIRNAFLDYVLGGVQASIAAEIPDKGKIRRRMDQIGKRADALRDALPDPDDFLYRRYSEALEIVMHQRTGKSHSAPGSGRQLEQVRLLLEAMSRAVSIAVGGAYFHRADRGRRPGRPPNRTKMLAQDLCKALGSGRETASSGEVTALMKSTHEATQHLPEPFCLPPPPDLDRLDGWLR